jgi:peptide deformylase
MKKIVQDGDPMLRQVAKPVPISMFGSKELAVILRDLREAVDSQEDGVAIAAPQISVPYRIFIVRIDRTKPLVESEDGKPTKKLVAEVEIYINPEIIKTSRRTKKGDEGCLSVRGIYGTTRRHERVTIRAKDEQGESFTRGAGGLMAQIFEHEVDHLNGILFIDHADHLIELKPETPTKKND